MGLCLGVVRRRTGAVGGAAADEDEDGCESVVNSSIRAEIDKESARDWVTVRSVGNPSTTGAPSVCGPSVGAPSICGTIGGRDSSAEGDLESFGGSIAETQVETAIYLQEFECAATAMAVSVSERNSGVAGDVTARL